MPIDAAVFRKVAAIYRKRWGIGLCAARVDGAAVHAAAASGWDGAEHQSARRVAIEEALRWGEPAVQPAPRETIVWGVPLLCNAQLLGGLVAGIAERRLFSRDTNLPLIDIRGACGDLRRLAEEHNLTNAALLEIRRRDYQREQTRAEAIHSFKGSAHYDIRAIYLLEEPMLIASIRKGDRGEARAILNRLLVGMIHRAGRRMDLVKSFFMELVAMMTRTAVEAGGMPEELLGSNYDSLGELAAIHDEQRLSAWLRDMLERIMDAMGRKNAASADVQLATALRFMAEHCCEQIGRDDAARAAQMSPSHFSRLFHKRMGRSFGETLTRMRIDRAADLLLRTQTPLKIIALECGFADQSYLTKVFRRQHGITPARYRREHQITKE